MNKSESNETNRTPQNLAPKNKYVISSKLSVQLHALQWGKYWNLDMQSELKLYEFDVAKKMFSALNTLILKTKACVRYFLSNFYFFTKWYLVLQNLWKMFFISSKKLFSFSRYSDFCIFSSSFPHFPDSKGQMEVE